MPLLATAGGASIRGFRPYSTLVTAGFISATGGTITTSGNYKYHTFTSSGTFSVSVAPSGQFLDFLVVGGGGGANTTGSDLAGGGGGGVVIKTSQTISAGSYAVTVGSGGSAGQTGGNSSFSGIIGLGGGGANGSGAGLSGGSGGGGYTSGGAALQPTSSSGG